MVEEKTLIARLERACTLGALRARPGGVRWRLRGGQEKKGVEVIYLVLIRGLWQSVVPPLHPAILLPPASGHSLPHFPRPTRVHGVGEARDRDDYLQVITASANSAEGMNRRVVERLSLVRHSFAPAPPFRLQSRS